MLKSARVVCIECAVPAWIPGQSPVPGVFQTADIICATAAAGIAGSGKSAPTVFPCTRTCAAVTAVLHPGPAEPRHRR